MSARAATFTVTTTTDADDGACDAHCSLREAVGAANRLAGDDTINLPAFLSSVFTLTRGEILIASQTSGSGITINGNGAKNQIISGNNASRVFRVLLFSALTINDLTIKDGNGTGGGVSGGGNIYNGGRLTLNRVVVSHGASGAGGAGLYINGGAATINDSVFTENSALPGGEGGAIYVANAGLTVNNSTLYGNSAKAFGGAIASRSSSLTLLSATVAENAADRAGGVYYEPGNNQSFSVGNSLIAANNASADAATRDVYTFQTAANSQGYNLIGDARASGGWTANDLLDRNPLLGSFGDHGGATPTVALLSNSPAIDAGATNLFADQRGFYRPVDGDKNGSAKSDIGAFEAQPAAIVVTNGAGDGHVTPDCSPADTNCTLKDAVRVASNRPGSNRIVFNLPVGARTIALTDNFGLGFGPYPVTIDGANQITVTGGNFTLVNVLSGDKVTLTNLTVSGGRGIQNDGGNLTLDNVRVTASSNFGLNNTGSTTIRRSLFDSNSSVGGIYNTGSVYLENTTVANNTGVFSGGIKNFAAMTLVGCTVAYNGATDSNSVGGIDGRGSAAVTTLQNTIIAGNTSAGGKPDVGGAFVSNGFNLVGDTTGATGFGAAGDILNPAGGARLATALAANGGALPSLALLAASPAIDAGNPYGNLASDGRGFFRPADGNGDGEARADIGAFERVPAPDLQAASDTGASSADNVTNDTTPTFDIKGVSGGATIALFRDGNQTASATSAGGIVTLTDPNAPANGAAIYEARITQDGATNVSAAITVTFDTTRPTAIINQAANQPDPSNVQPIRFAAVFSENVTGFSGSGVALSGTADVSGAAKNVTGGAANYTVEISRVATDGTVVANIPANAAYDAAGNGNFASTSTDNTISVLGDAFDSFIVTRADDARTPGACDADCTLREALLAADASRGAETISFSPTVFNVARTIVLNGELAVNTDVAILGTGTNLLTLSGSGGSRVMRAASAATIVVSDLTIKNGGAAATDTTDGYGGAIYNSGSLTLNGVAVINNTANSGGAAIYNDGVLNITRSTVADNAAADEFNNAVGGGIYQAAGSLTITDSTVSGNSAKTSGGGIYVDAGAVKIVNSTLAKNFLTASNFFSGAAIYLISGTVEMTNATVALNTASSGAGGITYIGTTAGALRFRNTVVAGNTILNVQSPGAVINSYGNNLFGTTAGIRTGTIYQSSDKINVDARLGALGNYGGATKTVELLADSPAINAGSDCVTNLSCAAGNPPAALTLDQRGAGFARKSGAGVDIGAFEVQIAPTAAAVIVGGRVLDANGRGLANALITLTGAAGEVRQARSNPFGYYRFADVPASATYIVAVRSKRFAFAPQIINPLEDITGLNFIASNLGFPM